MNIFNILKKNKGGIKKTAKRKAFSLVEIIVAVSLFSVIILSMTGIFRMVIEGQRGAIASQNVQESMKYFLEVINKEIRMAVRTESSDCGVPAGDIYRLVETENGDTLYFQNFYKECVVYSIENDELSSRFKISRGGHEGYISPRLISVDRLDFVLRQGLEEQDSITVNIKARALNTRSSDAEVVLQTTLSSRYYK